MGRPSKRIVGFVADLDARLAALGDPARAMAAQRYLKHAVPHLGVTVPEMRRATLAAVRAHGIATRAEAVAAAEALWAGDVFERRAAAVEVLRARVRELTIEDAPLLERLLRAAKTWALVDPIACDVCGDVAARVGGFGAVLDRWARDEDLWIRRSALLTLMVPLRRGAGDIARFTRYADAMLDEKEFFIRKAIGWVLREASKKRPELVAAWALERRGRLSGVTRREAVKYLTPKDRARILA